MKFNYRNNLMIVLLALALLGGGLCARVEAARVFVAVIITGDLERYRMAHEVFMQTLNEAKMGAEQVEIYVQTPNPDLMSWKNSIRKAVGVGADVIVTYGAPATLSAKKEARGVPLLFADVYDPVALNILPPGTKNVAGVSGKTPLETLVKTFREIAAVKTLGVIYSSNDEGSVLQLRKIAELAQKGGFTVLPKDISSLNEIEPTLASLTGAIDSLFVSDSAVLHLRLREILDYADRSQIPVISQIPGLCERGALITLEASPTEQGEVVAGLLVSLLQGTSTTHMKLHTPRKVDLVINLQVAHKLNLKVPFQSLSGATRVIR